MQGVTTWPIRRHLGFFALVAAGLKSLVVNANLVAHGRENFALFPPFVVPNSVK